MPDKNTDYHDLSLDELWALRAEYFALRPTLEDPKLILQELKQQQDLYETIFRLSEPLPSKPPESAAEYDSPRAITELRELFRRLQPILAS
ncbi:MAG: hypothetical protein WC712_06305 [Candidatus Brocadiia bacterium]